MTRGSTTQTRSFTYNGSYLMSATNPEKRNGQLHLLTLRHESVRWAPEGKKLRVSRTRSLVVSPYSEQMNIDLNGTFSRARRPLT
jgi:hypothetical protein